MSYTPGTLEWYNQELEQYAASLGIHIMSSAIKSVCEAGRELTCVLKRVDEDDEDTIAPLLLFKKYMTDGCKVRCIKNNDCINCGRIINYDFLAKPYQGGNQFKVLLSEDVQSGCWFCGRKPTPSPVDPDSEDEEAEDSEEYAKN